MIASHWVFVWWLCLCSAIATTATAATTAGKDRGRRDRGTREEDPSIPSAWHVLAPFPVGMRELGADPLEAFGGFDALPCPFESDEYDEELQGERNVGYDYDKKEDEKEEDTYPSELADGGRVGWSSATTQDDGITVGPIAFDEADGFRWDFHQRFFGWASLQWQGWARGVFSVDDEDEEEEDNVFQVSCRNVGEFTVDGVRYVADWYGYLNLWHTLPPLAAGNHTMAVHLVSSIRIFGGGSPPAVTFVCQFRRPPASPLPPLTVLASDNIVPYVVDGRLASPWAAVSVSNADIAWTEVVRVESDSPDVSVQLVAEQGSVSFAPGQTRPLALYLLQEEEEEEVSSCPLVVNVTIVTGSEERVSHALSLPCVAWGDTYAFTFQDYDSSVHYAMVRPPIQECPASGCPVLLSLHGAGVEASSGAWTGAYERQQHLWLMFPTGRTPWGYDWHGPSIKNIFQGMEYFSAFLPGVPADLQADAKADKSKIFYAGHSNGGQGCWFLVSHYPDFALAATPAAGYVKIELYVPYYLRLGDVFVDPILRGILESSIAEFDNDLHATNMVGIPLLARTGGSDDNVPPQHSRKLVRLVNELSGATNAANLSEVEGAGHWFDGIMDDELMQSFIDRYTDPAQNPGQALPPFPPTFTLTALNPASFGAKGTIRILQSGLRFRAARIHVETAESHWTLRTENVKRFCFEGEGDSRRNISSFTVDGTTFGSLPLCPDHLCRSEGQWDICVGCAWTETERSPSNYGPAIQVLEERFAIIVGEDEQLLRHGVSITNDWYSFGRGHVDVFLDDDVPDDLSETYTNIVLVGNPAQNSYTELLQESGNLPIMYDVDRKEWRITNGPAFSGDGLGVLFLAPWKSGMACVVAGSDYAGMETASLLFPRVTGTTVPDYIIVGQQFEWQSAGGIFAAGYWTNDWEYSPILGYSCSPYDG